MPSNYDLRSKVLPAEEEEKLWSTDLDEVAGAEQPRISMGLPRTPLGRLHQELRRELQMGTDPTQHLVLEQVNSEANQLPQIDGKDDRTQEAFLDNAAKSAVNVALAQAAETHRKAQESGVSQSLRDEIRGGFLEMMKLMNEVLRPAAQRPQLPQGNHTDQQQHPGWTDTAAPQAPSLVQKGAIPKTAPSASTIGSRPPPPKVPPKPPRRPLESFPVESSSPGYPLDGERGRRNDPRNWHYEDRRASDFREEPRLYANTGLGGGSQQVRIRRFF
uniref:Uncharacterized protein LOC108044125 n=1 Tax=Drosophila rhopaloa TaxID=1041015 RepID=A0A6P4ETW0_DRORH